MLDILFIIGVAWLSLIYASVFYQTRLYGALMISVGAFLNLLAFSLSHNRALVEAVLLAGQVLFWGGFAVLGTFERTLERERFRTSSWKEIFTGRVPEHLQRRKLNERSQLVGATLLCILAGAIFYSAGLYHEVITFVIIVIVFVAYLASGITNELPPVKK